MAGESTIDPVIGGQSRSRQVDRAIAALAGQQHGVVAREQLSAFGIGRRAIDHRVEGERLHVVHRGVYAVGHRLLTKQGRWMAAVLSAGSDAVLSNRAAGALWQVRQSDRRAIDVTTPRKLQPRPDLRPHRAVLPEDEITTHHGIPTTTAARTLLDLAAVLTPQALERALHQAETLHLTDDPSLDELLKRHPNARGTKALRHILATQRLGTAVTRSDLEDAFLAFLAETTLPPLNVNTIIEGEEVDFAWREARLVVELDGYDIHSTRQAFEADRARDRKLQAAGWRVVRITWRQLHGDQRTLTRELHALLAKPPPPLTSLSMWG
jgi:very-short-patch-repair endonuclease